MSKGNGPARADSTGPGDHRRGVDGLQLPAGLVRLGDPSVRATGPDGPPTVARLIAHRGRVTLLHAREKVGKSTLLRAAVAAVTRGGPFLEQPTISGRVLWVGEEAVGDVKGQLLEAEADLDPVFFIRQLNPNPRHASSLPGLVALLRPVWVIIDTWQHYLKTHRVTDTAGPGEQGLLLGDVVDLAQEYDAAITVSHHNAKNRNEYRDPGVAETRSRRAGWRREALNTFNSQMCNPPIASARRAAGRPGPPRLGAVKERSARGDETMDAPGQ